MYLYRKPKTQRRCSKPSTEKQKKQRELAWLLFRVVAMRLHHNLRRYDLPYNYLYHLQRFQESRDYLETLIRKELKRL